MNGVTPDALTALLRYMARHPDAAVGRAFRASLPLGGRDGTLQYRFRGDAPARERVRAKTGTLTGVNALAGYVTTRGGTELAFAILCNHHTTRSRTIRRLEDALVNRLAARAE
jgi:D-alanyl-D-alanine carboxypeptidase/D-alanyl-D-alanine-endopeptidase (penicillin-binding protein 4)